MRKLIVLAAVIGLAAAAHAAGTPAERCEAAKKQEAGKYAACRLKAEAKLVSSGDMDNFNYAVARCATKLTSKFAKLENDGACPTVGDAASVISFVATCSDTVASSTTSGGSVPICGDGALNAAGEECDGAALGGRTCAGLGFASGTLACTGGCDFNTAGCVTPPDDCGNGTIDAGEDCDLGNLNGGNCAGEGFVGGALECTTGCVYDTSECYAARFVDNANGTITDNDSGLTWEKKVKLDGTPDLANRQDADNFYLWSGSCSVTTSKRCQLDAASESACLASVEGDSTGCAQCTGGEGTCTVGSPGVTIWQWVVALNGASFGGHADWRVPTRLELESIVDLANMTSPTVNVAFQGASCGVACTDVTNPACSCTDDFFPYWSASTYGPIPGYAWMVHFNDGDVGVAQKTEGPHVRAVRGGS